MKIKNRVRLSFVVPVKDEDATIAPLFASIREVVLSGEHGDFEVVFVNDGSSYGSWGVMQLLAASHPAQVRALRLRRNFGKSVALAAGIWQALVEPWRSPTQQMGCATNCISRP